MVAPFHMKYQMEDNDEDLHTVGVNTIFDFTIL